jgi:thiamine-monophosphate kinase
MDRKRTPISELGEFGLIDRLTSGFTPIHASTLKAVGDDAAVLAAGEKVLVVTTDMLLEGIHFNLIYTPLKHLGYKAVTVNLSDVFAMNAVPRQITVSIGVSARFPVEDIEELYRGIRLACERYEVDLIGGDTVSSLTGLAISVTAIGEALPGEIVYRSGAGINDLICVSGDLGASYAGLQVLEREKLLYNEDPDIQPDLQGKEYILERHLKPEARGDVIRQLKEAGLKPTAMIDISDGLSSEIHHICRQSKAGCRIYQNKIPVDRATAAAAGEMNIEPLICALHGGEDYELLFTLPLQDYDKIKQIPGLTVIGKITTREEGCMLETETGTSVELVAQGWDAGRV